MNYKYLFQRILGIGVLVIILSACGTNVFTPTPTQLPHTDTSSFPLPSATTPDEVSFLPHKYGPLNGAVPANWVAISESEVMRGLPHEDPTSIMILAIPDMKVETALLEIAVAIGVEELPPPLDCIDQGFAWQCYEFETDKLSIHEFAPRTFGPLTVFLSLADTDRGMVAAILTCLPEEKEQLYRTIHLPVMQALVWGEPENASFEGIPLVEPPKRDYWPTEAWQRADPEHHGMDSQKLVEMADYIREHNIRIGSITIVRHGYLVYDETFPTYVIRHNNYSVTKSVTSALVGIAIDQRYLSGVEAPVFEYFPDREIQNLDARKESLTLQDLLSMTAGLDWPAGPFMGTTSPDYTTIQMAQRADYIQFVLDRPMVADPGTRYVYNSGASHLLSAIIQESTGQTAYEFAEQNLFNPLGIHITPGDWAEDPQGYTIGYSELRLEPHELAKIGYLYLNQGRWEEQQVISQDWVYASTRNYSPADGPPYGYQWWLEPDINAFSARGLHGQSIVVLPEQDMVVVFTSSLIPGIQESNPGLILRLFILPAVKEGAQE